MRKKCTIVGGGVAGLSALYALSKRQSLFDEVVLYDGSDIFTPCSLNSTAIVAPRGLSSGHSELGDTLMRAYGRFSEHVKNDSPNGVVRVSQFTGAITKVDQFKTRYPSGSVTDRVGEIHLHSPFYFAREEAFEITPHEYLAWLKAEAFKTLNVEIRREMFTDDSREGHVLFCGGVYNSFWGDAFKAKSAQGSYLEFSNVELPVDSFSLTLEGENLIYHKKDQRLLIGSTTHETRHELAPVSELREIYDFMKEHVKLTLPEFTEARIKVGLREKASKRMPYLVQRGQHSAIGGFYKNGFSLGLEFADRWVNSITKV